MSIGYQPHHLSSCAYYTHIPPNMYGDCGAYCAHPDRKQLDNKLVRFLYWLFQEEHIPCPAMPHYEQYCPLYNHKQEVQHERQAV